MPFIRFKVYNSDKFIAKPAFARQLRKLPDGSTGVEFRGKVYNIFENQIDISRRSFKLNECPLISSKQIINKKNIQKEDFFYDERNYNPIFFFNGLYEDLNSFLYNLDINKIDYLNADFSKNKAPNNENYDFEVKLSEESVKEKNINFEKIIKLFLGSETSFSITSVEKQIRDMIDKNIDKEVKEKNINLLIEKYPKKLIPRLLINLKKNQDDVISKDAFRALKNKYQSVELQLSLKNEEISTFNELLNKKADDEYKLSKISEQSAYISELEKNIDFLHNQNFFLKKEKDSFIKTDLKKKFLNYISNTFESLMPRVRLIQKSEIVIFEKFTNIVPLFKIIKKINDKENISFKKIRTSKNWFEVNDHISTGEEKRGRVYFSPLKKDLVALVVDYKYNDKDQFLKFEKIIHINLDKIN